MKTRSMIIKPDAVKVAGRAWDESLPQLVFETYGNAKVIKRVRVVIRPIDVQEVARALWELHRLYQEQADAVKQSLITPIE